MMKYSPLRYPGGKSRLINAVVSLLSANQMRDVQYAEAYAGGAGVALHLLINEYASIIHLNDLCPSVFSFWNTVLNDNEWLCDRIRKAKVTMKEWDKQKQVFEEASGLISKELGFATLFLNRTNRSGILKAGVIGGKSQSGDWKLDVRFQKDVLIDRIRGIGRFRKRIKIYNSDASKFVREVLPTLPDKSFFFFDPPYIQQGGNLYLNSYSKEDHAAIAHLIAKIKQPWIVTYDTPAIRMDLFKKLRRIVYTIAYTAQSKYRAREVMYLSNRLVLPSVKELLGPKLHHVPSMSRIHTAQ